MASASIEHRPGHRQSDSYMRQQYDSLLSAINFYESITTVFNELLEETTIYKAVLNGFNASEKYDCTLYLLSEDKTELIFFGSSLPQKIFEKITEITGVNLSALPIHIKNTSVFKNIFKDQKVYHYSSASVIEDSLPQSYKTLAPTITETIGYQKGYTVLVPFKCNKKPVGIIAVTPHKFFKHFVQITQNFCRQLSSALQRVHESIQSRKTEEALRANKSKLSNALQIARLGHWEYDIEKDLFIFNDEFYKIFKTTAEQVGGYTMSSAEYAKLFLHPDDAKLVAEEVEAALAATDSHFIRKLEHRIIFPDKSIGTISVRIFGIKNENGRRIKTYGVNQDITERRKAELELDQYRHQLEDLVAERTEELRKELQQRQKFEDELHKAQKLESLGLLAGGIAHDFNNLLSGLFGFVDLARRNAEDETTVRECLDDAMDCCARARDLTQQLLTFAKGGMPLKKCLDIEPIITKSIKLSLSGSTVQSKVELSSATLTINADEGQLSQVFSNILLNSRQSMPDGGSITITASDEELRKNEVVDLPEGSYVRLAFSDQGTGIPKDIISKVFDPFFTTKPGGSGIGLSTSYSIIKKHNGHISIDSTIGKGTTVTILLPALNTVISEETKNAPLFSTDTMKILFMDDDASICKSVLKLLESIGHEVVCSSKGEEAVSYYKEALTIKKPFSVVILDLTIIGGMGGEKTIRKLMEIDPNVKGIVSSGYADSPVLSDPASYGFSGRIAKPYVADELISIINEVVKN